MAGIQNFRSALNGFNRQDVVHYIEYLNNQHNAQLEQLNTQLQNAQAPFANRLSSAVSGEFRLGELGKQVY